MNNEFIFLQLLQIIGTDIKTSNNNNNNNNNDLICIAPACRMTSEANVQIKDKAPEISKEIKISK